MTSPDRAVYASSVDRADAERVAADLIARALVLLDEHSPSNAAMHLSYALQILSPGDPRDDPNVQELALDQKVLPYTAREVG